MGDDSTEYELVRDPTNKHDRNAVKVLLNGAHVGWVPMDLSASVAVIMAEDRLLRAYRKPHSRTGTGLWIDYEVYDGE